MRNQAIVVLAMSVICATACESDRGEGRVVGTLASDRIELTAETSEPIVDIIVDEGMAVKRGDVILRQNSDRSAARLDEATAAVEQARARLAELTRGPRSEQITAARANMDGARKEFEFRSTDYQRVSDIQAKNLASKEALDQAKASLDAARANLDLRRAQLSELLAGTTVEEVAQAEAAVKQAVARQAQAQIDLDRHTIIAPVDGLLDSRLLDPGERPAPGQVVAVMLDGRQPHARVFVPENMRARVRAGQQVTVHVDGVQQPLVGSVRWVSSDAAFTPYYALTERDRGRLTFAAKIDLVFDGERLPDGVPVDVDFDLEK